MLRNGRPVALLFSAAVLLLYSACTKTPRPEEARNLLVGKWQFGTKADCKHWGIDSDILILHKDGRLEQHLQLLNGKKYDSVQEHWEYMENAGVSLDRRLIVSDPQYAGIPQAEVLIVEFTKPPVILLNPDQDCLYEKVSSDE